MATTKEKPECKPTKFIPQRGMALIRRDTAQEQIGKFFVPGAHQKIPKRGIIVAIGPGDRHPKTGKRIPMLVKPGDHVVYGEYSGFEVEVGDETLLVVHEPELLGVIDHETKMTPDFETHTHTLSPHTPLERANASRVKGASAYESDDSAKGPVTTKLQLQSNYNSAQRNRAT